MAASANNMAPEAMIGAIAADGFMIMGLALRKMWGWWLSTIILSLRSAVIVFMMLESAGKMGDPGICAVVGFPGRPPVLAACGGAAQRGAKAKTSSSGCWWQPAKLDVTGECRCGDLSEAPGA